MYFLSISTAVFYTPTHAHYVDISKMTHYVFNKCLVSVKLFLPSHFLSSQNIFETDCELLEAVRSVISSLIILSCCFLGQRGGASVMQPRFSSIRHCHKEKGSSCKQKKKKKASSDGGVYPPEIYLCYVYGDYHTFCVYLCMYVGGQGGVLY